jgi:dTDP-4-amino-4,6-dideoxygalactose transaminase
MNVPFLDLKIQHQTIQDELVDAVGQVMAKTAFAGGPFVEEFETQFASFCQSGFCVGVGSGTEALWLTLLALGLGPGDEVITVPNTFMATAEAITYCGAMPVFVEIEEESYTMDPTLLEKAITPRTKAVIPVHLFGQMADMDPIMEIADSYSLYVIEDAAQAHGAEYKGRVAGSIGDAGCFSFYPGKNLGACGEAGAVVTSSSELDYRIRMLRDHGQAAKYHHKMIGWNARMDGLQGAILNVKLKHLPSWTEKRRENAQRYDELLSRLDGLITPTESNSRKHVYHIYAVRVDRRDEFIKSLAKKDIFCGIHYPIPVHLQEAYRFLRLNSGAFPIAELCASQFVSLPMFAELSNEQMDHVAGEISGLLGS